jgi:hypothetical protein
MLELVNTTPVLGGFHVFTLDKKKYEQDFESIYTRRMRNKKEKKQKQDDKARDDDVHDVRPWEDGEGLPSWENVEQWAKEYDNTEKMPADDEPFPQSLNFMTTDEFKQMLGACGYTEFKGDKTSKTLEFRWNAVTAVEKGYRWGTKKGSHGKATSYHGKLVQRCPATLKEALLRAQAMFEEQLQRKLREQKLVSRKTSLGGYRREDGLWQSGANYEVFESEVEILSKFQLFPEKFFFPLKALEYDKGLLPDLFTLFDVDLRAHATSHENMQMSPLFLENMPLYYSWLMDNSIEGTQYLKT